MSTQPLVSIVTACYKHERYVDDYFQGLLNQTYSNVELIFIDDGSPDGTFERARRYEGRLREKFPRVHLLTQQNQGGHAVIRRGLGLATGELICFLESDDFYFPTKIEKNVRYLQEHPEVGVVHSDVDRLAPDRIDRALKATRGLPIPIGDVRYDLLRSNFISSCTACCRRDLVAKHARLPVYQARGYLAGDWPLWLDLARHCRFGYIPEVLACYRASANSATQRNNPVRRLKFHTSLVTIQWDFADEHPWPSIPAEVRASLMEKAYAAYYWARESNNHADAARWLCRAVRASRLTGLWLAAAVKLPLHWARHRVIGTPAQYPELEPEFREPAPPPAPATTPWQPRRDAVVPPHSL